jgi:hypothetical protein
MLFRRMLFQLDCCKIVVLDGQKWDIPLFDDDTDPPVDENPFPLFSASEWDDIVRNSPRAFCITTDISSKKSEMEEYFVRQRTFTLLVSQSMSPEPRRPACSVSGPA